MDQKFCGYCGSGRHGSSAFCVQCGKPFGDASSPSSANSPSTPWLLLSSLLLLGTTVIAGLVYWLAGDQLAAVEAAKANQQAAAVTNGAQTSGHQHEDPPEIARLRSQVDPDKPETLLDLAEGLIRQGQKHPEFLAQAADVLSVIVRMAPEHAYSLRLLGNVLYGLEAHQGAVDAYKAYLQLHPEDANVWVDMGTQMLALGQADQAVQAYKKAVESFPDFYHAYHNLKIAYETLGEKELAAEAIAKAQAIEAEFGRQMAPIPDRPRLPIPVVHGARDVVAQQTESRAPASTPQPQQPPQSERSANGGELEKFFRAHPIVGPKVVAFDRKGETAVLTLANFPMDAMPPFARKAFDEKVQAQLAASQVDKLEIRDAQSAEVLAQYGP